MPMSNMVSDCTDYLQMHASKVAHFGSSFKSDGQSIATEQLVDDVDNIT